MEPAWRERIESGRYYWLFGFLFLGFLFSAALGPFGLALFTPHVVAPIAVLAAQASRPLVRPTIDRYLTPALFLVILGPTISMALILVFIAVLPGEQAFELGNVNSIAKALILLHTPLALGFIALVPLTLRVRGRPWEARLATYVMPAWVPLGLLYSALGAIKPSEEAFFPGMLLLAAVGLAYVFGAATAITLGAYFYRILRPCRLASVEASVEVQEGPTFRAYR